MWRKSLEWKWLVMVVLFLNGCQPATAFMEKPCVQEHWAIFGNPIDAKKWYDSLDEKNVRLSKLSSDSWTVLWDVDKPSCS